MTVHFIYYGEYFKFIYFIFNIFIFYNNIDQYNNYFKSVSLSITSVSIGRTSIYIYYENYKMQFIDRQLLYTLQPSVFI